jgi:hypothetical protein
VSTETAEVVETLYKSTILGQTEAVLRPSGTNRKPNSPLLDSLGNSDIRQLIGMLTVTEMLGSNDILTAAVASGVAYGYDSKQMPNATSLLLNDSYKQGVQIVGTDVQVSYQELTDISEQILTLATTDLPEILKEKVLSEKSKFSFCVVFGAELARYHKGLAALDMADFTASSGRDDLIPPDEQAEKEVLAWGTALSITMARVNDALDHPEKMDEHLRLGDYMPDVFYETMSQVSSAVHALAHEKGGEFADCEAEAHHKLMMAAFFMFGRTVEEMATSRLHHLDDLRFGDHKHH